MKQNFTIALLLLIGLNSCTLDNNSQESYLEMLPVESVKVPETFIYGETHKIDVSYLRPTDCHTFNNFIFNLNGNERTVVIINTVFSGDNCRVLENEIITESFDLEITSTDSYVFKFYQGENQDTAQSDNLLDCYLIIEVPVVN